MNKSFVKPNYGQLQPYRMVTERTRRKVIVEFSYSINGDNVTRKFKIYEGTPIKLLEWYIRFNKRKFENKVLRYLARMELVN